MDYLPIQELANKWNISKRRIQFLCREGRIDGAKMIGNMWVVPSDAQKPADARVKNPLLHSEDASTVRRELKKVLKKLFQITDKFEIETEEKCNIVFSSIAYSLCALYIKEGNFSDSVFAVIYKDISGKCGEAKPDPEIMETVRDFIEGHMEDAEINNILSWTYQYSNKIIKDNIYSQTQFFTENYW